MYPLSAGPPIEAPRHPIGRRTTLMADPQRDGRLLGVDVWYPSASTDAPASVYELLPGVSFRSAGASHEPAPLAGPFPLIVFSHGRTGTRFAYSMLCEALAARGAIVVSADHPGDVLSDWLLGTFADDRTNEVNRVADAHALLAEMRPGGAVLPADLLASIDHDRVVLMGHSYGAYTAFATAAGARGVPAHDRVCAVVGLQPFTRSMSDDALRRVRVPSLLVVAELDSTTPASTDADRPWQLLTGPAWRADLAGAGHQAASDVGLYADLARNLPFLPTPVQQYLDATAGDSVGPGLRPWREALAVQVRVVWSFLQVELDIDRAAGVDEVRILGSEPGLSFRVRSPEAGGGTRVR
jgi:predicted dienelactone hydrolase